MDVRADVVQPKILIRTESVTIKQKAGSDEMKSCAQLRISSQWKKAFGKNLKWQPRVGRFV